MLASAAILEFMRAFLNIRHAWEERVSMRVSRDPAFCQELFSENLKGDSSAFFVYVDKARRANTITANFKYRSERDSDRDNEI